MIKQDVKLLLQDIKNGVCSIDDAMHKLEGSYYEDLGFAKVDHQREKRVGYPEVIYCEGKTVEQSVSIIRNMQKKGSNILATRVSDDLANEVTSTFSDVNYNATARTLSFSPKDMGITESYIAVVTGGTSDLPVAEEAKVTAEFYGSQVKLIADVGVAGIHRLMDKMDLLKNAKVLVVAAGMEGALPSVVAGLIKSPVIAVPTSIGYGASFKGLAALLAMLNSCASGISVVNIDNGFGAGYQANLINRL